MKSRSTIETPEISSIVLAKTLLAFNLLVPSYRVAEWQAGMSLRQLPSLADEFAMSLHVWFLEGHKLDVRTERDFIKVPASPWEFFKLKYAPKWFVRRWPVQTETKEFRVAIHNHYVCPHVEPPDCKGINVHYAWMGEQSGQIPTRYKS